MEIKLADYEFGYTSYFLINFNKVKKVAYLPDKELITFHFDDDTTFEFSEDDLIDRTLEQVYNQATQHLINRG